LSRETPPATVKGIVMVAAVIKTPVVGVVEPPTAAWLVDNPAANASIARYLSAGELMQSVMDVTWKLGAVLFILVLAAWVLRLLPGAVRLF
jgi:hypothetical protein